VTEFPGLSSSTTSLLTLKGVTKRFNGVVAVDRVDLEIRPGELLSLIGPNGSGKTTLFNCITGYLRPEEGRIFLGQTEITHERPDRIALHGISRTFQNVRIFPGLTVLENMLVSLQQYQEENLLLRTLHAPSIRRLEEQSVERAMTLLEMVQLSGHAHDEAHSLVYGQRKMLEFACSLIPDPQLVLLDEPAAGVSTALVDEMKRYILQMNQQGKTFFVVEHNMGVVMDISQRIIVLDYGQKIAEGSPSEIRDNPQVREAYFGK
jgi:ABC-type branched-subunit amino acid transport system ATPase component